LCFVLQKRGKVHNLIEACLRLTQNSELDSSVDLLKDDLAEEGIAEEVIPHRDPFEIDVVR